MAFLTAVIGYQYSPVCRGSLSRVGLWVVLSGALHRHNTNTSSVWKTLHRLSRVQQKFILFSLSMWRIFFQFKCKKKKFDQNKDILRSVSPLLNCIYLMSDIFIVWLFLVVFVEVLVSLEGDLIRMKTNIYLNDTLSFLYLLSSPSYFCVCVQHLDGLSFVMQVRRYMFLYLVIPQSITVTATRFHLLWQTQCCVPLSFLCTSTFLPQGAVCTHPQTRAARHSLLCQWEFIHAKHRLDWD